MTGSAPPAAAPPGPARAVPHPPGGYVFIVTYGRSGSTLLQNLLNAIDGYCIRGENENILMHLARGWHAVQTSRPMRGMRSAGRVSGPEDPWFGAEAVDPGRLGRSLAALFLREVLRLPPGTRVGGFKEIRFLAHPEFFPAYLDFLHRFFPGTRIVFNTRDHAAVARSGWWARMDPASVAARLREAERLFAAYQAAHPGRCITLHYDDYVRDPAALAPLFAFLGEPFDAARVAAVMARRLDHLKGPRSAAEGGAAAAAHPRPTG